MGRAVATQEAPPWPDRRLCGDGTGAGWQSGTGMLSRQGCRHSAVHVEVRWRSPGGLTVSRVAIGSRSAAVVLLEVMTGHAVRACVQVLLGTDRSPLPHAGLPLRPAPGRRRPVPPPLKTASGELVRCRTWRACHLWIYRLENYYRSRLPRIRACEISGDSRTSAVGSLEPARNGLLLNERKRGNGKNPQRGAGPARR
jgi:hypothetical protein